MMHATACNYSSAWVLQPFISAMYSLRLMPVTRSICQYAGILQKLSSRERSSYC
jgi:hypothetical protein